MISTALWLLHLLLLWQLTYMDLSFLFQALYVLYNIFQFLENQLLNCDWQNMRIFNRQVECNWSGPYITIQVSIVQKGKLFLKKRTLPVATFPGPGPGVTSGTWGGAGSWSGPGAAPRPRGWFCGSGHRCSQPTSNCHTQKREAQSSQRFGERKKVKKVVTAYSFTFSRHWLHRIDTNQQPN